VNYISLFSGIDAASVAWIPLGWKPLLFAEIEKFPCDVLKHHYPDVPNLGDVTAEDFIERAKKELNGTIVDVLIFGSPCQGFSVAGKRLGLDDPRSNLALHALRICRALAPTWILFENVPGLFSSWSGAPQSPSRMDAGFADGGTVVREFIESSDFAEFLRWVSDIGYSGAWTVLDAQYRDLAQRRERVFFVGCVGDWAGPAAVLLESESLSGNIAPSREARQGTAEGANECANASSEWGDVGSLCARDSKTVGNQFVNEGKVFAAPERSMCLNGGGNNRIDAESETFICEVAPTIDASYGRLQGQDDQHINSGAGLFVAFQNTGQGWFNESDTAGTIRDLSAGGDSQHSNIVAFRASGQNGFIPDAIAPPDTTQVTSKANRSNPKQGDPCHTLAKGAEPPTIAIGFYANDSGNDAGRDVSPTLRSMEHGGGNEPAVAFQSSQSGMREVETHATLDANNGSRRHNGVAQGMAVRRLTPKECARLQGFGDKYLDIKYRGKPAADGVKYRALGNSMAVPVIRYIGERIQIVHELKKAALERLG